jgi:nucleotide-binding universal stress UspA family protein
MKKILVGLDGSPREQMVLDAAIALARKFGAELVLLRSVGIPHELPIESLSMSPNELPELLERGARSAIERVAATVPADLRPTCRTTIAPPWQAICREARQVEADLIVIGSHGYGGMDKVLGTTAAKVVNHADRSVLVVRAPERLAP